MFSVKGNNFRPARGVAVTSARTSVEPESSAYSPVLPGPWQLNTSLALLFLIVTAALYAGDLHLGFFRIDDPQYVVGNHWIKGFSWKHVRHILTNAYFLNYSPIHLLSYTLDYAIGGLNPYVFHLSSNLWAGIVSGFVYLVALALTRRQAAAVAAGLLFVVHPVHVEAIAWISSRKDLVAAAFVLPSVLAYLKYRESHARSWYIVSLFFFFLALLGKLSVVTLPALLLALDLFIEKRRLGRSIDDKIPFCVAAIIMTAAVARAQPSTGLHPDTSVLAKAYAQGMWLLTGLGNYVIYRVPPAKGSLLLQLAAATILLGLFLWPLLLRKRYPLVTVLIYWVLFTYLPTQILPFVYPVTDRYLFLPSVGAVILIAWLLIKGADHLQKWNAAAAAMLFALVSLIWIDKAVEYLSEWQDPRSVWFAATRKSQDVKGYYHLSQEYLDKAARLGSKRTKPLLVPEEAKNYAAVVWKDDPRLSQLLSELSNDQHNGPAENTFKDYLQSKAAENLDKAVAQKGQRSLWDLFLTRAALFVDKGDMQSAKRDFVTALDEANALPSSEMRQEALIACHYNLAVAEATSGHLKEAVSWLKRAEEEQNKLGTSVIPELTADREKLESMIATLHGE